MFLAAIFVTLSSSLSCHPVLAPKNLEVLVPKLPGAQAVDFLKKMLVFNPAMPLRSTLPYLSAGLRVSILNPPGKLRKFTGTWCYLLSLELSWFFFLFSLSFLHVVCAQPADLKWLQRRSNHANRMNPIFGFRRATIAENEAFENSVTVERGCHGGEKCGWTSGYRCQGLLWTM